MKRTQIFLDDAQTTRLDARARALGRTRSDVIREAIADYLDRDQRTEREAAAEQRSALLAAFGAEPDIAEHVTALHRANRARADGLDRRWGSSS